MHNLERGRHPRGVLGARPGRRRTRRRGGPRSLLSEPPSEAHLLPARIELAPVDARRLARSLWALDAYRARVVVVRDAINDAAGDPPAGPLALRAFAAAIQPVYEAISRDPLLPDELLPDDWPGA